MNIASLARLSLVCALPLCTRPAGAQATDARQWSERLAHTGFSLAEAVGKSTNEAKGGVAYKVELEQDGPRLVYSIDLAHGSKTVNVVLDAKSGEVVENETEDGDQSALVRACKTSLMAAIAAATPGGSGRAIEATMRMAGDKPVVDVEVFDAKAMSITTVRVDGLTGALATARPRAGTDAGAERQAAPVPDDTAWTDIFHVTKGELRSTGRSAFMILEPGHKLYLSGKEGGKSIELIVSVLAETKTVDGVETRVVEERESADGELVEVSRNYFAISATTSSVYYFGEDVDMYEGGKVVSHEGAWRSGDNGARFGLFLPGTPLLGGRFYQEIAPEVAMDRAEIVALDETVQTPAGRFERVMKYEETTPMERGKEYKWFAPGVGLIRDAHLELVKIEK